MGAAAIPDLGLCRRRKAVPKARDSAGARGLEVCGNRVMDLRGGVAGWDVRAGMPGPPRATMARGAPGTRHPAGTRRGHKLSPCIPLRRE